MSVLAAGIVLGQLAFTPPKPPGDAPTLTLSDRTEARVRSQLVGSGVAYDIDTLPVASLTVRWRRTDLTVGYAAHIAELDIFNAPTFTLAHSTRATLGYLFSRRTRGYVAADGSIGKTFSDALVTQPVFAQPTGAPVAPAFTAPVAVLNSYSYRGEVGVGHRLTRRWDLLTAASYGGGEGLDAASKVVIPHYQSTTESVSLGYAASRADRLATSVAFSYTTSSTTATAAAPSTTSNFYTVSSYETWTHAFSLRTTGYAGLGVSWQLGHTDGKKDNASVYPDGQLGLAHTVALGTDENLSFRGGASVGFRYDAVLRTSSPEASAVASAAWTKTHVGASATVDGRTTLPSDPPQPAARQLGGGVVVWYSPIIPVRFEAGARVFVQNLPDNLTAAIATATNTPTLQPNAVNWAAFVAVTLFAPVIEL